MSVDTRASPGVAEHVKDWAVPVVGGAWTVYIGLTCVKSVLLTVVFFGLFGASMALAYATDASRPGQVTGAILVGTLGLGGVGIACSQGTPLIEELLYVLIAAIAVVIHADRQMIR